MTTSPSMSHIGSRIACKAPLWCTWHTPSTSTESGKTISRMDSMSTEAEIQSYWLDMYSECPHNDV